MSFAPITITRIDADHYRVGRIDIVRQIDGWAAVPPGEGERPLFTAKNLEAILDMAHGACEMMRPAPGRCRHGRPDGDCPECVDEMTWDIYSS
jgi:hypothetical protein